MKELKPGVTKENRRRYALHQTLKRHVAYTAKGHQVQIFADKADILPRQVRRAINELKERFKYNIQFTTYDTSPLLNNGKMFISFKSNDGQEGLINLDKVSSVVKTGTTLSFYTEQVIQLPDHNGAPAYGHAVLHRIDYPNEAESKRAFGIITRAVSPKKI